jgi:hypothetical protein
MERDILLLALYKKEPDESAMDVVRMLENARVFGQKEGKKILKELKKEGLLDHAGLTPKGVVLAQEAERFFKL